MAYGDNTRRVGGGRRRSAAPAGWRRGALLSAAVMAVVGPGAAGLDWDIATGIPGVQGGSGTWSVSNANKTWFNGTGNVSWTNGVQGVFGGTQVGTVTLDTGPGAIVANDLRFLTPGYVLDGGRLGLVFAQTIDAQADVTFANGIDGTFLVKTGAGTLSLTSSAASGITQRFDVNAGTLRFTGDQQLGTAGGFHPINLSNGATLRYGGTNVTTLGSSRQIVAGATGGRLVIEGTAATTGLTLTSGAALSGSGTLSIGLGDRTNLGGALNLNGGGFGFTGVMRVDGGVVNANASYSLAEATVVVQNGGRLNLNHDLAVNRDVTVVDGRVAYNFVQGANGHTISAVGTGTDASPSTGAIEISAQFGVGQDRFVVGAGNYLRVNQTTQNVVLTRGGNLTLAAGAVVSQAQQGTIANLGTAADLMLRPQGAIDTVFVGSVTGFSPWAGLSAGADDATMATGNVFGTSDFTLQALTNTLAFGTRQAGAADTPGQGVGILGASVTPGARVTASVVGRAGVVLQNEFNNVQTIDFRVTPNALLVLDARNALGGTNNATGVEIDAGGVVQVGSAARAARDQVFGYLRGSGRVNVIAPASARATLSIKSTGNEAFDGTISGEANLNILADFHLDTVYTLNGNNTYTGSTTLSSGVIRPGASEVFPDSTTLIFRLGGRLQITGQRTETVRAVTGLVGFPEEVQIEIKDPGDRLNVGSGGGTTIFGNGKLEGNGTLSVVDGGVFDLHSSVNFGGTVEARGGKFRLGVLDGGQGKLPSASALATFAGGLIHIDNTGGNAANRVFDGATYQAAGGTMRLTAATNAPAAETIGVLAPLAGATTIDVTRSGTSSAELSFFTLGNRAPGSTINFTGASVGDQTRVRFVTTAPVPPGGPFSPPLIGWGVANGVDFVKVDSSQGGIVTPFTAADYSNGFGGLNAKISGAVQNNGAFADTINMPDGPTAPAIVQFPGSTITTRAILKSGTATATIGGVAGPPNGGALTAFGDDLVFYVTAGELDVSSRIDNRVSGNPAVTTPIGVTKSGAGRLTFSGAQANGYTGKTFVNEGELVLNRSGTAAASAVIRGDVDVNGGTLRLAAADQIADAAVVTINSGAFRLGGFSETIGNVDNKGGLFESGSGVLTLTQAVFEGGRSIIGVAPAAPGVAAGAALPAGGAPLAAPGPVTSTASRVTVVSGSNSVEANSLLVVGLAGLTFSGGGTPNITLAAASGTNVGGRLKLTGDIFVNEAGTRASITGGGVVDLNGVRFITPDPSTRLEISATVANGIFSKSGAGLLRLSGPAALTGATTVTGGTLEYTSTASLSGGTVVLSAGTLSLLLPLSSSGHAVTIPADVRLAGDAALVTDETDAVLSQPGRISLRSLSATGAAAVRLAVSSPNNVTAEFSSATFDAPVKLDLAGPMSIAGPIGGTAVATFTKDGVGTLTLGGGAAANTYKGPTVVQGGGVVELQKAAGVAAIPNSLEIKGIGTRVRLQAGEQIGNAATIKISGGGMLDLNGFTETVASVDVSGGGQVVTGGGNLVAGTIALSTGGTLAVRLSQVAAGAAVTSPGAHAAPGGLVLVGGGLDLSGGGTVDLTTNAMVMDYAAGGPSPLAEVKLRVRTAFQGSGGAWSGPGITSSAARADGGTAVGYAEASDVLTFASGSSTFMGRTVDASTVLARYTLAGDATLDGIVDFNDLVRLAQNYNVSDGQRTWAQGDATYDGIVDFNDLVKLAQNYNTDIVPPPPPVGGGVPAGFAADMAAAFASVPEPGGAWVLAGGVAAALGRRRRGRRA